MKLERATVLRCVAVFLGFGGVALMVKGCADPAWGKDVNATFIAGMTSAMASAVLAIIAHSMRNPGKSAAQSIGISRILNLISIPFYMFGVFAAWQAFWNRSEHFIGEVIITALLFGVAVLLSAVAAWRRS